MKKIVAMFAVIAVAALALGLTAYAHPKGTKTMSWTGWISDSGCAAKGMSASHKACAQKCVKEKGASWVFVNSKTKKVFNLHNQDAVKPDTDLGQEVKLTGHVMDDGSIHVDKIAPAGSSAPGSSPY